MLPIWLTKWASRRPRGKGYIPTRSVSEGRTIQQNPSLTRRVGIKPTSCKRGTQNPSLTLRVVEGEDFRRRSRNGTYQVESPPGK